MWSCWDTDPGGGVLSMRTVQVYNAINVYNMELSAYPAIAKIYERCLQQTAFDAAMPEKQPDFAHH